MTARNLSFEFPRNVYGEEMTYEFCEASMPIFRNACFYGEAANLRKYNYKPIVVGTANFDEAAYLGFWGKASDAAQDFYPISHLHKSEIYAIAKELNVPQEIIDATPSGDLMYSGDLNDLKMIGATYDQIEKIARLVGGPKLITIDRIIEYIGMVNDPKLFIDNIVRNKFKYELPFPGFHISYKLEWFRKNCYSAIHHAATLSIEEYA